MTNPVVSLEESEVQLPPNYAWWCEGIFVLAALIVVTSVFYYEVVFLGRTLVPVHAVGVMGTRGPYGFEAEVRSDHYRMDLGASAWAMEPWTRKVSKEYASGRLPLWNEHQGFGAPLLANAQSGGIDLLRLPVLISGSSLAWDIYYLARVMLGGLATYLFARTIHLVGAARLFLAIAYVYSGHFLLLGNNTWVEAYFLLPVVLLGSELLIVGRTQLGFLLTSLAVCLGILVGMPEVTLFILLLGVVYGGCRLVGLAFDAPSRQVVIRRGALLFGAWIVGLALAAPLLLTLLEFVGHSSTRASERSWLGQFHEPLANFVVWFIPYLNGLPLDKEAGNYINTYVGTTVLMLVLYSLQLRSVWYRWQLLPFVLVAMLLLAKTFGMPGVNALGRLPILNVTLIQKWSAPVTGFCLALLASVGVHHLITSRGRASGSWIFIVFSWLSFGGLVMNWEKIDTAPAMQIMASLGAAFVFATAVWLLINVRHLLHPVLAGLSCCCLVAVELFMYAPRNVYQHRYDRFVEPPYVRFLRGQQDVGLFRIFAADGVMFPNSSTVFGIDDIRSLDALYIDRYLAYIQNFINTGVTDRFVGYPVASGENDTLIVGNPWFDAAGVRYVLVPLGSPTSSLLMGGIMGELVKSEAECPGRAQPCVHIEPITIDGITKPMLFEHPPATLAYPVTVTPERAKLEFSLALHPKVWDPFAGDGVGFEVIVDVGGSQEVVFRDEIDPKHNTGDSHWLNEAVDLSRFSGQDIVLIFRTDPLKSSASDWAGWADVRLTPMRGEMKGQYTMVYDGEIQIFENRYALPRAFLVESIVPVADMGHAITVMRHAGLEPGHTAIVEGVTSDQAAAVSPDGGTAIIRQYNATEVTIDVDAKGPSFLVLADSYYPGWIATIDGVDTRIYPTDLAFRGVFVPEGQHRIEFVYRPASFWIGAGIAFVGLVVLLGVSTGLGFRVWNRSSGTHRAPVVVSGSQSPTDDRT